jgi:ABC-type lipoprotein export system ATPase subunit
MLFCNNVAIIMIQVENLSYAYQEDKAIRFPDFTVKDNEHCLLLGESGSGKTTLLHLIGGLLKIQQGKINVNTTSLHQLSESSLDKFRGQHLGFIFQKNHLISALSVKKNLLMAPFLSGLPQDNDRVGEVLTQLGLEQRMDANVRQLSQGQAQRVAIARAILNKPSVILADEPTSALDDKNCERVIELLVNVARANKASLLIATHDQRLKAKIAQQILL